MKHYVFKSLQTHEIVTTTITIDFAAVETGLHYLANVS